MPLFMIGTQRSGSNLLRLMLNQLPDIAAPHPPHIMQRMMPLEKGYGDLAKEANFKLLVDDVCRLVELNPVPWVGNKLDRADIASRCRNHSVVAVFGAVYDVMAEYSNAKTWCCKSLANINYVKELEIYYGDAARYIYLYRDGRDVAVSFRKAVVGEKHPYFIATEWGATQRLALAQRKKINAKRFYSVSYENLTTSPEDTTRGLCKFLGVPYTDAMLDFNESTSAVKAAKASELWSNVAKPLMENNSNKFLKEMSDEDIRIFELVAGDVLDELGYKRYQTEIGEAKKFTAAEIKKFDAENQRLKEEVLSKVDPEDMKRRDQQAGLIKEIKDRQLTGNTAEMTKTKNTGTTTVKKRPRPVLMIPLRRCGSHALRLRLNASPDFYSPYPLHIVDFMPLVSLYGDLKEDKNYFQMVVDVVGLQTASMVKWPELIFDPVKIFEAIQGEPRSVHRIVWELLFQAGEVNHAKVVMDKSLDSVHYAEELMTLFDDILFLNVVRDPRAQVSSMNKAIIHDFDSGLNATTWLEAYAVARSLAERYPKRVLTIRYEDFLTNQEVVLRKICEFFGIEFLKEMLDVSKSSEAKDISKMSALWESNLSAPIAANKDKFKQTLSMEEIEIIETITGRYMDFYGYERMTEGKAILNKETQKAAKVQSELKKKKAWDDLKERDFKDYTLRRFRIDYLQMIKNRMS